MKGLRLDGEVDTPREIGFAEMAGLAGQVDDVGAVVPGRRGGAVRLATLLAAVGARPSATHATLTSADGRFAASVPLAAVADALVVYRLGDAPLPAAAGGPFRFLVPAASDCATGEVDACANVKDLARIRLENGPGKDTRPTNAREHAELHEKES